MKNPFEWFKSGESQQAPKAEGETAPSASLVEDTPETSLEAEKAVENVEFSSEDGRLTWREKYTDGSVDVWKTEDVDMGNPEASKNKMAEIRQNLGLESRE